MVAYLCTIIAFDSYEHIRSRTAMTTTDYIDSWSGSWRPRTLHAWVNPGPATTSQAWCFMGSPITAILKLDRFSILNQSSVPSHPHINSSHPSLPLLLPALLPIYQDLAQYYSQFSRQFILKHSSKVQSRTRCTVLAQGSNIRSILISYYVLDQSIVNYCSLKLFMRKLNVF